MTRWDRRTSKLMITLCLGGCALAGARIDPAWADPPPGYYASVDARTPLALRQTVHSVIDDHTRYPYTSSSTDTWDILDLAQQDPNNGANILDVYKNASYAKAGGGNSFYNREHAWPKSYGFPLDISTNYPYTDCHHLMLGDSNYNSARGNKPYRYCNSGCTEKTTLVNDGQGGGSGSYPGNSNWTSGSGATGTWETWIGRQGDVARALLYMDVRYEGGTHGITGAPEPDLILTNNQSLIVSDTTQNKSVAYMGMLTDILAWHKKDKVDAFEQVRHEVVFGFQGNRNPFIDHPEWVDCIFEGKCARPWINEFHYDNNGADTGEFVEVAGYAGTDLTGWKIIGYDGATGAQYQTVNLSGSIPDLGACMGVVSVSFTGLQNGSPDGIALVAADNSVVQFLSYEGSFTATNGPASGMISADVGVSESATSPVGYSLRVTGSGDAYNHMAWQTSAPASSGSANSGQSLVGYCAGGGGPSGDPWVNELHYDNSGTDVNEFIEVAGPAGLNLASWKLIGYNGSDGLQYKTVTLSGSIPNQQNGFGTLSFAFTGFQNGAPDGLALVNPSGVVLQFLSYEGAFVALDGPASGLSSSNIGVSEDDATPSNYSLRLTGTGHVYSSFTWQSPAASTSGSVNTGQTLQ